MGFGLWSFWLGINVLIISAIIHFPFEFLARRKAYKLVRVMSVSALFACAYTMMNGIYWIFHYNADEARQFATSRTGATFEEIIALWIYPYWPYAAFLYGLAMSVLYFNYIADPKGTSETIEKNA